MDRWVEISFDCLPLRSVGRMDIPIDASPKYRALCERIKEAIEQHGSHNTYFLYNARCIFHLTNDPDQGSIELRFQGTVFTDSEDVCCERSDLEVELLRDSCDWLTEPIVNWFVESVSRSVIVEFNRYIEAGDLQKAKDRIQKLQETSDEAGGYLGMYL